MKKIVALIVILNIMFFLNGCSWIEGINIQGELHGGDPYYSGLELPAAFCSYRSEKRTFDIDDVTLTFYFGGHFNYSEDGYEHPLYDYPDGYDIFMKNDSGKEIFIRHSTDNFVSEKYYARLIWDKEKKEFIDIEYNYSENITIPKELFSNESGIIYFYLMGDNILYPNNQYGITGVTIYYIKSDNKILLFADKSSMEKYNKILLFTDEFSIKNKEK